MDDDDDKMETEVQGKDNDPQEQSVQPETTHEITPYAGESE